MSTPAAATPSTWFGPGRTLWLAPDLHPNIHPPTNTIRQNYTSNMGWPAKRSSLLLSLLPTLAAGPCPIPSSSPTPTNTPLESPLQLGLTATFKDLAPGLTLGASHTCPDADWGSVKCPITGIPLPPVKVRGLGGL